MNDLLYRPALLADYDIIARLIAEQNRHPETHCVHSDTAQNEAGILLEMQRLHAQGEIRFMIATRGEHLAGAKGCEFDEELGRAWLRGPFIHAGEPDWQGVSSAMFHELVACLPDSICVFDSFMNVANERGNQFYQTQAFKQPRLVHVYQAASLIKQLSPVNACDPLQPSQTQSFIEMHESLFPGTYATGQRILEKLGDTHRVFVTGQKNELAGYVYAVFDEELGEGSIEFIGVRETERGKNLGRRLLMAALHWLFEDIKVPLVTLVVNDHLTNARSLYESAGFRLKYTGVHLRRGGTR